MIIPLPQLALSRRQSESDGGNGVRQIVPQPLIALCADLDELASPPRLRFIGAADLTTGCFEWVDPDEYQIGLLQIAQAPSPIVRPR